MSKATDYTGFELQWIDGRWITGNDSRHINHDINPYDQTELLQIQGASRSDVDHAYKSAEKNQTEWARDPSLRMKVLENVLLIMKNRRDEIIDWLIHESGSTRIKAQVEWELAYHITERSVHYPLEAEGRIVPSIFPGQSSYVYREPVGVIGIISPWNVPLHLTMRSLAPALALGNTAVLKPASNTPVTGGLLCGKIFEEAGLPAGVLHVIVGAGNVIGDYFVEHPIPSFISFTGSSAVGREIGIKAMSGARIKRVALELGGSSPFVVLDDADIDLAVSSAIAGKFFHNGQICMSTNRIIADKKIHDELVEKLVKAAQELKAGDPSLPDTDIGPIIDKTQVLAIEEKIKNAIAGGADLLLGGKTSGQIIPPHILDHVHPSSSIVKEEIFGPILPIITARDETEALRLANDTDYGLSSVVFTRNMERGLHFARKIRAGMTHINGSSVNDQVNAPFGGEKNSGTGRFNGHWIMDEFTRLHWITYQSTAL